MIFPIVGMMIFGAVILIWCYRSNSLCPAHFFGFRFWITICLKPVCVVLFEPFLVDNKLTEPKETVIKFDDDKILMLHNLYVDGMLVFVIPEHLDLVHT